MYNPFMCGFIGFINKNNHKNNDYDKNDYENKFNFFHKQMLKRGPDYQEKYKFQSINNKFFLGFSRLSITDLSKSSNKIFQNENFALLFNGEIYNYLDLKVKYLQSQKLDTESDTEVLFNLLTTQGIGIVSLLEGIFSFVFINLKEQKVYMAKDPTGTKPLYYYKKENLFSFSSEAWFNYSLSNKELDLDSLNYFFNYGFSPVDKTLVKGVCKVKPGHIVTLNLQTFETISTMYYSLNIKKKNENNFSTLKEDIEKVIKKNLISDVKTGLFLSGGLDSTIIAIISKKIDPTIEAYTSVYLPNTKYRKFNEDYKYVKKISKDYNIKINTSVIDENDKNQKDEFINFYKSLDEPLANLNVFNSYLQSKSASLNGCKVVLTGDGSDEVFGGYKRYRVALYRRKLKFFSFIDQKIKKFNNLPKNKIINYFYSKNINNEVFSNSFKNNFFEYNFDKFLPDGRQENIINFFDLVHWLPEESNFKLDRSTMFNSIEGRVPFQDVTLLNKYFPISMDNKVNLFNEKIFLKKSLDFIPNYIKNRKKIGWLTPESFYLRNYLKNLFIKIFDKEKIQRDKIFNYEEVMSMLKKHNSGQYFKDQLITILSFQIWYDQLKLL